MTVLNLVEHARALVCATPKGDKPAPKGKPEKKTPKIPVPKIKINRKNDGNHANNLTAQAIKAQAAKDDLDLPEYLDRKKNGVTADDWKDFTPTPLPAPTATPEAQAILAEQAVAKKTKAQVRAEKKAAAAAGASKAMPLTGKAALAAIAKDAVENGKVKVTKVPAGASGSKMPPKAVRLGDALAATPAGRDALAKVEAARQIAKREKALGKAARKGAPKAKKGEVRTGTKLALIVGLLQRKQGCTTADVLKATGWPAVSMPQQAKAAGVKLVKEKDGKVTRYRAG